MIWLTRPQEDSEALARALKVPTYIAPVTIIRPLKLLLPPKPQGAILTSRHAVAALPPTWYGVPIYAVGEATAKAARDAGYQNVHDGGGDTLALVPYIANHAEPGSRLVYLRGEQISVDIAALLATKNISVLEVIAYEAVEQQAPVDFYEQAKQLNAAVFFSARNARIANQWLEKAGISHASLDAYCLSLAVADAAGSGWRTVKVAEKPTTDAMIKLVASASISAI